MTAIRFLVSSAVCLFSSVAPASGVTFLVNPDGTGDYPTIQAAINASVSGDDVILADGVFTGPGNRELRFATRRITLKSLSGDPTACVIDAEHETQILIFFSETSEAVVENIGLLNGWSLTDGGIIFAVSLASPTIRGCIIAGGRAERGGGIYVRGNNQPIIDGCWIFDNEAADGGGIYAYEGTDLVINDSVIVGNRATGLGGGGLWFGTGSSPAITGTTIARNEASEYGGGLFLHAQTIVTMDRGIFWQNTAGTGNDVHVWDLSCDLFVQCSVASPDEFGGFDGVTLSDDVISEDPLFCMTPTTFATFEPDAFALEPASPCLPANNACASLMGARPGCAGGTPTRPTSWSGLKARF